MYPIVSVLLLSCILLVGVLIGSSCTYIALKNLERFKRFGFKKEVEFLEDEVNRLSSFPSGPNSITELDYYLKIVKEKSKSL